MILAVSQKTNQVQGNIFVSFVVLLIILVVIGVIIVVISKQMAN